MANLMKKGILIVNTGTIDTCNKKVLANYLREFLMDERVIDIPLWKRWLLVNGIIVPTRTPKVIKEYQKLFTHEGSPLLTHGNKLSTIIKKHLGSDFVVELAMRYQTPSIKNALFKLREKHVDEIIVFPLFPQYASATVGSIHQQVMKFILSWHVIPRIRLVSSFYKNPLFINCYGQHIEKYIGKEKDFHLVFSYHGIPQRHVEYSKQSSFGSEHADSIDYNYQSACFQTSKLLAERLNLSREQYTTCFQSRLGKEPWIQPYTSDTITKLAQDGEENIIACSPSFVADCLETTIEIGEQYRNLFLAHGGKSFTLIDSLNSNEDWAEALVQMIKELA
ncbi:MAG: ferrochelatase [Mangrovibacterium sp.]